MWEESCNESYNRLQSCMTVTTLHIMRKFFLLLGIVALFAACQKEVIEDDLMLKGAEASDGIELAGSHYKLDEVICIF